MFAVTLLIISLRTGMHVLLSLSRKVRTADMLYLRDSGFDEIRELRHEMLAVTKEDILKAAPLFDELTEKGSQVIIGNAETLADKLESGEWRVWGLN